MVGDSNADPDRAKKRRQYGQALKNAEQALCCWQLALEQESHRNQELNELTWVLSEYIYVQEQLTAIYKKHQEWLRAGGPHATPEHRLGQQQHLPSEPDNKADLNRPHWVLHLLSDATWEQLQLALSMDCAQWIMYQMRYCSRLLELSEISTRCLELQHQLLSKTGLCCSRQHVPAAYSSHGPADSNHTSNCDAADGDSQKQGSATAWDVIVDKLKQADQLVYLSLLHGHPSLFEAMAKHLETGEERSAPPQHWVTVARRMKFSRQQKLHFKLALELLRRQARAAAATGLNCLQQAPSYAFILACEMFSAGQSQVPRGRVSGGEAAAAAVVVSPATQEPGLESSMAEDELPDCRTRRMRNKGTGGCAARRSGKSAPAPAGGPCYAGSGGSTSTSIGTAASLAAAGAAVGEDSDSHDAAAELGCVRPPDEELQHVLQCYFRDTLQLSIFLRNTLTLNQGLILSLASYPFFPQLAEVAQAAVDLPDTPGDTAADEQPDVSALMMYRRTFMQQVHEQWWRETMPSDVGSNRPGVL